MTVKIANLLTPPSTIATATLAPNASYSHFLLNNSYDNFTKTTFDTFTMPYSTSTSIMTNRGHPFNQSTQSTQALLPNKKQPQLLCKKKFNYGIATRTDGNGGNNNGFIATQHESAVKLQGINDFGIISKHYMNLNNQHRGYPYGSPPSPTANSRDFVFSDTTSNGVGGASAHAPASAILTPSSRRPLYDNGSSTPYESNTNYYCNTSRFEDDFCSRRNDQFDRMPALPIPSSVNNNEISRGIIGNGTNNGGPFIFGDHHQHRRAPTGGRVFLDSTPVIGDKDTTKYSMDKGQKSMFNSDTSSSSRDSGNGSKLLKKNRKTSKKNSKEKKFSGSNSNNNNKENSPQIKCVVVGDADVGKTNLIVTYLENRFIPEHVPTASDIYNAEVMVNDSPVHVTLCDTAGKDTLDPLRELCYPDCDVFLLCFSVVKPETFHSIKTKWAPKFSKNPASLILVGTQSDLRNNNHVLNKLQTKGEKPISVADALDLAASIKAKYIETSSYTQEKVKDVFDNAIWDSLVPTTLPPTPSLWRKLFCLV